MKVVNAQKQHFQNLQTFILPYEQHCVLLASHIRTESEHLYFFIDENEDNKICGIIFYDGTILHCIPKENQNQQLRDSLKQFFSTAEKPVKCMNGEKTASEYVLGILKELGKEASQSNFYNLMILEEEPISPPQKLSCDDEIRRCSEDDIDLLLDLQKKYLIKEVAPVGKQVSDMQCAMSLRQILKTQLAFALYSDCEPVAKANTNAIGWNWIQLGGVFTHPLYRKNYYAWHLMIVLIHRIQKTSRKVCLYVKEKNIPAIELYKKIGFVNDGKFEIDYFD